MSSTMKSHYEVIVIGGGAVGCSILFHLAKLGKKNCALLEKTELTAGSSWHAAGGFHTINADPYIAALQAYTIKLYKELEETSGQPIGIHRVGGINLASSPARRDYLKSTLSVAKTLGIELHALTLDEVKNLTPIINLDDALFATFDPLDGYLDPSQATHAYAKAARVHGAEVFTHTPARELVQQSDGAWTVVTPRGNVKAEIIVNAGGLWGREVARLVSENHFMPIQPMEHHYFVTEDIPEVAALEREVTHVVDFEGESYMRQEGKGLLLGTYETNCVPWQPRETPDDFGPELLPDNLPRIAERLEAAYRRYPCLRDAGIKRVVNGPFAFAGDGNPLIGPVPGIRNYFAACGVMAAFSQGGGVGLSVAQWIIDGEPDTNTLAMDVSRYGDWATQAFTTEKVKENYGRRFQITYPNEELMAGRPLKVQPVHEEFKAAGAVFTQVFGLECPTWFAGSPEKAREEPSFYHSDAHPYIAAEARAVRTHLGLSEIAIYGKHLWRGAEAANTLSRLLAGRIPAVGRVALTPMLSPRGRLIGDFTIARLGEEEFFMVGSRASQDYHRRWFLEHLPPTGLEYAPLGDEVSGFLVSGPRARDLLQTLTPHDLSNEAFPFFSCVHTEVAGIAARVLRLSFTGELGYEVYVATAEMPRLMAALRGQDEYDARLVGVRAILSLRLEKGFGSWMREYTPAQTALEAGLGRFVSRKRNDFIGRDAFMREEERGARQSLRLFEVASEDTDAIGNEPIMRDGVYAGFVTSGDRGHTVDKSLALGYVLSEALEAEAEGAGEWMIELLGEPRGAKLLTEPPVDPSGARMRS
ncbi:MAG: FAD-dependent oxidoreductase [Alphaproteobacteria bacterium]|nr:FAD-dependent oxidoreductase [Alphaproteobacteria bacterium]